MGDVMVVVVRQKSQALEESSQEKVRNVFVKNHENSEKEIC